ncbi:MAG: hypothetical protein ABI925_01885 [Verrucomicrobiota bacterium]
MVAPVRVPLAVLCVVLFGSFARADLQLTPEVAEYELDGAKLSHLVFPDGSQRVNYTPPHGWQYVGDNSRFILHPKSDLGAEAIINTVKLPQPQIFDESTMKRLSDEVIASLPSAATHVTIASQQKNPVVIENKETFLIIVNYDCYGTLYARSVMFLNRRGEQMRFQLTSSLRNFAQLQKQFLSSHFSWQNL